MARSNADRAIAEVLKHEAGYVDHPLDPGGCTNKGITIATYRAHIDPRGTCADLRRLSTEQAVRVYRAEYWDRVSGDALPAGVDLAVFDFGVNSGPRRAARFLQRQVGAFDDGIIGPKTLSAIGSHDPALVVKRLCNARLAWLQTLGTWPAFGRGWTRRVSAVKASGLQLAAAEKKSLLA